MHCSRPLIAMVVFLTVSCSDNDASSPDGPATTASSASADTSNPCALLSPDDFAVVGFTVATEGEDVSESFTLSTASSVACQWMNDDDNISSSWELVIGTGDAEAAFDFELSFAEIDTVTTLEIGDEAYLADKVSSFDSADHDYEAGVRIGDTFFTLSTTDDRGAEAIAALARLVADRLAA